MSGEFASHLQDSIEGISLEEMVDQILDGYFYIGQNILDMNDFRQFSNSEEGSISLTYEDYETRHEYLGELYVYGNDSVKSYEFPGSGKTDRLYFTANEENDSNTSAPNSFLTEGDLMVQSYMNRPNVDGDPLERFSITADFDGDVDLETAGANFTMDSNSQTIFQAAHYDGYNFFPEYDAQGNIVEWKAYEGQIEEIFEVNPQFPSDETDIFNDEKYDFAEGNDLENPNFKDMAEFITDELSPKWWEVLWEKLWEKIK